MENKPCKKIELWMHDNGLRFPKAFFVDIDNVFPALRPARVKLLRKWLKTGPFRRQPELRLFFLGPNKRWVYAQDWILDEHGRAPGLVLSKEKIAESERCILSILNAYQRCQSLWQQHETEDFDDELDEMEGDQRERTWLIAG